MSQRNHHHCHQQNQPSTYINKCTHPFCIANPDIEAVHAIIVVRKDPNDCIILGKAKGDVVPTDDNSKRGKYDLIGGNTDGKCIFQTLEEESIEESRLVSIDEKKRINIFFKPGTTNFHVEPWQNVSKFGTENKFIFVGEIDLRNASGTTYYYRDDTKIPQGVDVKWDGNVDVLTNTIQTIIKKSDTAAHSAFKDNTEITCQNAKNLTSPTYGYAANHIKEFENTEYYKTLTFS